MLVPAISNEPDRGAARAARADAQRADGRAPQPDLPRGRRGAAGGRARARRRDIPRALPRPLRLRARRARRPVPGVARTRRSACSSTHSTAPCASASASASPRQSAGTCGGSSARRAGTRCSRPRRCCPRCGRPSASSASRSTGSRTSSSTSSSGDTKSPRAFCAPIEVPDRVVLVIQPMGGPDDWRALFHEAGHTEHFAHTSPDLLMEEKRLGDNAVTEGWAMLLEHLTNDPAWLSRRLDFPDPQGFAGEGALQLLWLVRRYCAKLLYELEFHAAGDPPRARAPLRRAALRRAEDRAERGGLPRATSTPASTSPRTCARGPSRRSCARSCASAGAPRGSPGARRARCCGSCGSSARSRRRTSC